MSKDAAGIALDDGSLDGAGSPHSGLTRHIDIELVTSLLEGDLEDPPWSGFLKKLRTLTNANYASLIFRPRGLGPNEYTHVFSCSYEPPQLPEIYWPMLFEADPVPYEEMVEGKVYSLDDLLSADNADHRAYMRDFLAPSGVDTMRMMRIVEPGGVSAWLNLAKTKDDFLLQDDDLVEDLAPFLRTVVRHFVHRETVRAEAIQRSRAYRRLNFGCFTLDKDGRILDADAFCERVFAENSVLVKDRRGFLSSPCAMIKNNLTLSLRRLRSQPDMRPYAMIVSRDPWLDLLLFPAIRPAIPTKSVPTVVGYIHGDSCMAADRCDQLAQLFDLSASEARVALAIARGMKIDEIAADLHLTLQTVRTYLKRIYGKVGARSQADLVTIIYRSVLALV